jgi:hypothetical protein
MDAAEARRAVFPDGKTVVNDPLYALRRVFHLPGFRGVQRQVIDSALAGEDVFVIMPTGAGKSLCYQVALPTHAHAHPHPHPHPHTHTHSRYTPLVAFNQELGGVLSYPRDGTARHAKVPAPPLDS